MHLPGPSISARPHPGSPKCRTAHLICITNNAFPPRLASNASDAMQGKGVDLAEIGKVFKAARRASGRTQAELARSLGMSRATLSALENGRCGEVGVRKLSALLESVGLNLFVAPRRPRN